MDFSIFIESLGVMWKGMLAILSVMALLAGGASILNRTLGQKKGDKGDE